MKAGAIAAALLASLLAWASSASADYAIWLHPALATPEGSTLTVSHIGGPAITVTTNTPGDLQWLDFPVIIPSNVQINSVQLCYKVSDPSSYISQIRIAQMREPPLDFVYLDDGTDLTSTTATCVTSAGPTGGPFSPAGMITVELRLNFANVAHTITIGALALNVAAVTATPQATMSPASIQNHPNPFRPATTIDYDVTATDRVEITIYDASGKLVRTLVDGEQTPGSHHVVWDGRDNGGADVAAGTYFYRLTVAGREAGARKMILVP